MPYTETSDNLPENVKKMGKKKRKQWVAIFNSSIEAGDSESSAFAKANGVVSSAKGWVDEWEVSERQIDQVDAGYDPLGATGDSGCGGCRWFVSPDSCVLVSGDISPTGVSKFFLAKTPYVPEPIPVTIVKDAVEPSKFKQAWAYLTSIADKMLALEPVVAD